MCVESVLLDKIPTTTQPSIWKLRDNIHFFKQHFVPCSRFSFKSGAVRDTQMKNKLCLCVRPLG